MIEKRIKMIMAKVFNVPAESIGHGSSNENIEKWDSLGHMNLCLALEEEFGVELDGDRVASMTSYPEILTVISAGVGE